jgi:hypothetical protein
MNNTSQNKPKAIVSQINSGRILKNIAKFSDHGDWINELIQNAYRSGASKVKIDASGDDFIIEDDGHGLITNEDWSKLIFLAESGWKNEEVLKQDPAGMGIFSALARFDSVIHSRNTIYRTTPEKVQNSKPIDGETTTEYIPGLRIELKGASETFRKASGKNIHPTVGYRYQMGKKDKPLQWEIKTQEDTKKEPNINRQEDWDRKPQELTHKINIQVAQNQSYLRNMKTIKVSNMFEDTGEYCVMLISKKYIAYNSLRYQSHLVVSHHGQIIREKREHISNIPRTGDFDILIDIYGESPINLVHPHRERIQKDEKYENFLKEISTKVDQWLQNIREQLNVPEKVYPDTLTCGKVGDKINLSSGIFEAEDKECPDMPCDEDIPKDALESGFFKEERNPVRQSEIIFSEEFDRNELTYIKQEGDEKIQIPNNQIIKAIQDEALAGKTTFTYIQDPGYLEVFPGIKTKIHSYEKDPRYVEKPKIIPEERVKTLELSPNQKIEVFKYIHFLTREGGKQITFQEPVCIHINTLFNQKSIANEAYMKLMQTDPDTAFEMWIEAIKWSYENNDEETYDGFINYLNPEQYWHLFIKPDPLKYLKGKVLSLLRKTYPHQAEALNGGADFFLKNLSIRSGKLQNLDATFEEKKKGIVHKVSLNDQGHIDWNTTERKKR